MMTKEMFDIGEAPSLLGFFKRLFSQDFIPHGHCYFWRTDVLWLHVLSDALIALAYVVISVTLIQFTRKRKDLPFPAIFYFFGVFIILCGMTHLMDVYTTWWPLYRVQGLLKLATAVASIVTAGLLIFLVPKALLMPSLTQMEAQKKALDEFAIIVETDIKGRITYVNDQFCKISKYSREELMGKDHRDVANSGHHSKEFWQHFWATIQAGKIWHGDVCNKAKDGTLYWEDMTIVPFPGKDGKPEKYLAVRANITERKIAERKILEFAQMKNEFISTVSHELRTPLTVIKESIGILEDGTAGSVNPEQKSFLETAKRNVDRLARLINNVLDFQKLEIKEMETNPMPCDINEVVKEARESFALVAERQGLGFVEELEEGLPPLRFNRDRITQVLTNFVSNAIKVTEKGKVTLKTKRLENAIRVSVEDQGPGIKEEDLPKLFKPFSQLATGGEIRPGSTGLGLAICKQIIEAHHGKIDAESVYGQGATFYFILPIIERRNR